MPKLFACVISPDVRRDKEALLLVAGQFSHAIEVMEDGLLFDVSGLDRLVGKPQTIAKRILAELEKNGLSGRVAVAGKAETATLLARRETAESTAVQPPESFTKLPLHQFPIEPDTLNVFADLGVRTVEDLLRIPHEDLIGRYGKEFREVLDLIQQNGASLLTPNVKQESAAWSYDLDSPIEDFEQLIFLLNHGLEKLFAGTSDHGFSTEQIDITFRLREHEEKTYEIRASFPTLERAFWLKLVNLRVSLDPPGSGIVGVRVVSRFTKPRASQRGLYAVSRPEPENLLLTVGKLKRLVGEENVGVPVMLDQRLAEAFTLDADALPKGTERMETRTDDEDAVIAFNYFRPPVPAEVHVKDKRLVHLRTRAFSGRVVDYSGVWRADSKWWSGAWCTEEWDVEVENHGVYRLCLVDKDWFLAGEYD
jgi:protein ImuB